MAKLKIELKGDGIIDNAAIFLEDPMEKLPHYLTRKSDTNWIADGISLPLGDDDELTYALYVVAFSGTKFSCVITNTDNGGTISLADTTGKKIKNKAIVKGEQAFEV